MMWHRDIWSMVAEEEGGLAMIVEADFVPCVGMGKHPLPLALDQADHALGLPLCRGGEVFDIHEDR